LPRATQAQGTRLKAHGNLPYNPAFWILDSDF
jgi:hypothetical protein